MAIRPRRPARFFTEGGRVVSVVERSAISPATLGVHQSEEGIEIEYLDGRRVRYRAPPTPQSGSIDAPRTSHVHVLVRQPDLDEGIIVYLNDHKTSDAILASTGVGRVLLEAEERVTLHPGVTVTASQEQLTVEIGPSAESEEVFVFVETQLDERAYRLAPETGDE